MKHGYTVWAIAVGFLLAGPALAGEDYHHPKPQPQKQKQHQDQDQSQGQEQSQTQANAQSVNIEDSKQAPSTAQGSIFIPECGAGGNAGGSNSGGSAFLGVAYVPAWCQDFKYAAWLVSVGDYELACEVMANAKPGKRAVKRGLRAPKCAAPAPQTAPEAEKTSVVVTPDLSGYVTREELKEREGRIVEAVVGK